MKGWMLLVFVIAAAVIFLREWPRFGPEQAKEKSVFLLLMILGLVLAVILRLFPLMPGPTDLVDAMFRPLADWLDL